MENQDADTAVSAEETPTTNTSLESDNHNPTPRDIFLVLCISFVNFVEKIIYYGILTNLVIFCTNNLNYSSANAAVFSLVFTGTNYVFTFFGGLLSDSLLGNYNSIFLGLLICLIGTSLLPLIAFDWTGVYGPSYGFPLNTERILFVITLMIVNVGCAPLKACCGPFSGIQVEEYGQRAIRITYHWVYFISEFAPLFTYSILSYVEQNVSFFLGFIVVLCFNLGGIIILAQGRGSYKTRPPRGDRTFLQIVQMLRTIITRRLKRHRPFCSSYCWCCCCQSIENTSLLPEKSGDQTQLSQLDYGEGTSSLTSSHDSQLVIGDDEDADRNGFLEWLKREKGGPYPSQAVDEFKWLLNTLVVLSVAILYSTIRFQYSTTYLLQGERMNIDGIPVAFLAIFVYLSVIIAVPIVDRIVYPCLESRGIRVTLVKRMAFGLLAALLSVLYASAVEVARKYVLRIDGSVYQEISGAIFEASPLSILVQIPQYIFIGVGDVFVVITGLEFSFSQSPKNLQAFITGVYLFYNGIGSYLGSLLVIIVNAASAGNEWIPNDINKGHLEYYFLVLAGVILLNMIYLYVITKNYQYVTQYDRQRRE